MSQGIKAVILCGGQGTRIRDANETLPKPMLPIGGRPIVSHIMQTYAAHGCKSFVLCLGYKGWLIKEHFLHHRAMTNDVTLRLGQPESLRFREPAGEVSGPFAGSDDWSVTLAETGESTMTGARIARVRRYVEESDVFFATYGDGVSDVDLTKLLAFHRAHGRVATVTAVRPPGRFGEMVMDGDVVEEFNEKPQATEGFINGGYFVFDAKRIWDYLGTEDGVVLEREPLQRLSLDGQLRAFRHAGFWQPMDTLREYQLLNDLWASGRAPWRIS
jgi:glucose-1-phosphate cytidylyltransferase